jgi:hypothetical protein
MKGPGKAGEEGSTMKGLHLAEVFEDPGITPAVHRGSA